MKNRNLKRMANYIKTIPQKSFNMKIYRNGSESYTVECNSIGCVIGHCVILDKSKTIPRFTVSGDINFEDWSVRFTGLNYFSNEWDWCFNSDWSEVDNTPIGASKRIEWMLKNGVPNNWEDQLTGNAELCYN
jgi:hypothetical protein